MLNFMKVLLIMVLALVAGPAYGMTGQIQENPNVGFLANATDPHLCAVALVDSSHALTSAICLGGFTDLDSLYIGQGPDTTNPSLTVDVDAFSLHPDWYPYGDGHLNNSDFYASLAVLYFAEIDGVERVEFATAPLESWYMGTGQTCGYGGYLWRSEPGVVRCGEVALGIWTGWVSESFLSAELNSAGMSAADRGAPVFQGDLLYGIYVESLVDYTDPPLDPQPKPESTRSMRAIWASPSHEDVWPWLMEALGR